MIEFVPSFGCHQPEPYHETVRQHWRRLFTECRACHGPQTLATVAGIPFFLCIPCTERQEAYWKAMR